MPTELQGFLLVCILALYLITYHRRAAECSVCNVIETADACAQCAKCLWGQSVLGSYECRGDFTVTTTPQNAFSVIVLTKDRPTSLFRLLSSIKAADYGDDTIDVAVRVDGDHAETQRVATEWVWPHKTVQFTQSGSLQQSWLDAWVPTMNGQHAIILEDDVELSAQWHTWLTGAWRAYGDSNNLAGISLQRQTLIPQNPSKHAEIVNNHLPFLFKLVGSIGFSPHPQRWHEFLAWVSTKNLDTFDARVDGLVTSDWYNTMDKKTMWTQLFIRFCEDRGLFVLYVNCPNSKTLAAHWREKGEHFKGGEGKDFALATTVPWEFPTDLAKYGWDGVKITSNSEPSVKLSMRTSQYTGMRHTGTVYGGWTYNATGITSASIVYSVGIGEDTSWDEAMIRDHGLHVWGFDPTPKSVYYVKQNRALDISHFHFTAEGLAVKPGTATFTKPQNPAHVSMRQGVHAGLGDTIDVTVNTLENWMRANKHTHIDILKIDIEGSEYAVLEDYVERKWFPVDQLLVEFHQRIFKEHSRHDRLLDGLKRSGFKIIHNRNNQEYTFTRSKHELLSSLSTNTNSHAGVPIVLIALSYQIASHMLPQSIPLMCKHNSKVIVLTNIKQYTVPTASCLEIVDVKSIHDRSSTEMPWPSNASPHQKVFFDRWYVLRDWMRQSNTRQVFTMDCDSILTLNVTTFVSNNYLEISKHDVWIVYNPPRSSLQFALLTRRALENITEFWNYMFQPNIWTSEFVKGTEPNDMVAMGHYSHIANGKPYPCWGYGKGHAAGSCDDSIDYGHTKVLDRLIAHGVRAAYPPGSLTLNEEGHSLFSVGVVDNNYRHDPIKRYEMRKGQKQLRFWRGIPQLKLAVQRWVTVWGYVLEDETEKCATHHFVNIKTKASCMCNNWCCDKCKVDSANSDTLTVWSVWRNDTRDLLIPHVRFYTEYWKADRLFLNVGYDRSDELGPVLSVINNICGVNTLPIRTPFGLNGASIVRKKCVNGYEIWILAYKGNAPTPSVWSENKLNLMTIYSANYDITPKKMYVDADEFFVPAYGDVATARQLSSFNYHMVMIKPTLGTREWSNQFEWVDQPYYYRLRSLNRRYPDNGWDGNEPLTYLNRKSHNGPFSEHNDLALIAAQCFTGGMPPTAYKYALRSVHTMYHMSVSSEEIFLYQKHFDQTVTNGARSGNLRNHFATFYLNPEKDFVVFGDNFMHAFFTTDGARQSSRSLLYEASRINQDFGVVVFQLFNEGYVEMTKSWICNVRRLNTIIPKTVFVATDQPAYSAIAAFDPSLTVVYEPHLTPTDMQYGQRDYYNYMLFRTGLIVKMLASGITVWLVESDAVWFSDPTETVVGTLGDIVTMSDLGTSRKLLQGGFQMLRPTHVTIRLWKRMHASHTSKMHAVTRSEISDYGSEQLLLDTMIHEDPELRVGWLDPLKFVPGSWYTDAAYRKAANAPIVVLNNWIIGNAAKIKRSKQWKHWFLYDSNSSCIQ